MARIPLPTLQGRGHPLADPAAQLRRARRAAASPALRGRAGPSRPRARSRRTPIEVLQVNVGKLCNQTCAHCHVDAGPDRREVMSRETARAGGRAAAPPARIPTLDITGGAPELNPQFRFLVTEAPRSGRRVIDRCNLSVLLLPSQRDLVGFLAEHARRGDGLAALLPRRRHRRPAGRRRLREEPRGAARC